MASTDEVSKPTMASAVRRTDNDPFGGSFNCWVKATRALDLKVEEFFFNLGLLITKRPKLFIVVPLLINLALIAGVLTLNFESGIAKVWLPQDGEGKRAGDVMDGLWGLSSPMGDPKTSNVLISRADGGDVLQDDTLLRAALEWHNDLVGKVYEGKNFSSLCAVEVEKGGCGVAYPNVLDFFDFDEAVLNATVASNRLRKVTAAAKFPSVAEIPLYPQQVFGGLEFYATTAGGEPEIKSATSFFLQYRLPTVYPELPESDPMAKPNEELGEFLTEWENDVFLELCLETAPPKGMLRDCRASVSFDAEFDRAISGDIIFFGLAFVVMMVYCVVMLGKFWSCVQARKALAAAGLISVLLAIGVAIGLGALFGIAFTSVTQIVPFLALGIGVDDMYVIVSAYEQTSWLGKGRVDLRVAKALQTAGGAITVTSVTSMVAFAAGATTKIPAIRWYCGNLAIAVLFDFFNQVTFFVAFLYLDSLRLERNAADCCCCCGGDSSAKEDEPPSPATKTHALKARHSVRELSELHAAEGRSAPQSASERFIAEYYAPFLMQTKTKIAVFVLFAGVMAGAIYGTTSLSAGFKTTIVLPDDSYLRSYYDKYYPTFDTLGLPISLVLTDDVVDYYSQEGRDKLADVSAGITSQTWVRDAPGRNWLDDYEAFLTCTPCCPLEPHDPDTCTPTHAAELAACRAETESSGAPFRFPCNESSFYTKLPSFVEHPVYGANNDVLLVENANPPRVANSRILFSHPGSLRDGDVSDCITAMGQARKFTTDQDSRMVVFNEWYNQWEQYAIMETESITNLIVSASVVFAITGILLVHPGACLIVFLCVVCVDFTLLGYMSLWGIEINAVSVSIIVIAVGIAVDYSAHVAYAFMKGHGTRNERATKALVEMAFPVMNGAVTTFLGVICLGLGRSEIFRIFFRMFFLIIIFSTFFGLMVLPVFLSVVGPRPLATIEELEEDTGKQGTTEKQAGKVEMASV